MERAKKPSTHWSKENTRQRIAKKSSAMHCVPSGFGAGPTWRQNPLKSVNFGIASSTGSRRGTSEVTQVGSRGTRFLLPVGSRGTHTRQWAAEALTPVGSRGTRPVSFAEVDRDVSFRNLALSFEFELHVYRLSRCQVFASERHRRRRTGWDIFLRLLTIVSTIWAGQMDTVL